MRSLRSRLRLMRLAVTLATQPPTKPMRALAMSMVSDSTEMPLAEIDSISRSTRCRIRSISWIIRSSTTLTSVARAVNGASRVDSMKRGPSSRSETPSSTLLKRSMWPTCSTSPPARASAISSAASSTVVVTGFSIRQ